VRILGGGGVEFRMIDAGSGAHALQAAGPQQRLVAKRVPVAQLPVDEIDQDFGVVTLLAGVALARLEPLLVHDLQRTEVNMLGVVIVGEAEGVVALQPSMIVVAAVTAPPEL